MNGNNVVLDSNFLIFVSKGKIDWEPLRTLYDNLYVSIITYVEVYAYNFVDESEKASLDDVLDYLEVVDLKKEVADQSIIYRKNKMRKIKLPDAVILTTAKTLNADLITDNLRDFQNIDPLINALNLDQFKV